jgi:hypothetical protein
LGPIGREKGFLSSILDGVSLDAAAFLTAKPADQAKLLLENVPMEVTVEELVEESKLESDAIAELLRGREGMHALDKVRIVREEVFGLRRDANTLVRNKTAALAEFEAALPPASEIDPTDYQTRVETLEAQRRTEEMNRDNRVRALRDGLVKRRGNLAQASREETADLKSDLDDKLANLKQAYDDAVSQARSEFASKCGDISKRENDEALAAGEEMEGYIAQAQEEAAGPIAEIDQQLAEIRSLAARSGEIRQMVAMRDRTAAELNDSKSAQAMCESGLIGLDSLRNRMLAKIHETVPGLEVENGKLILDGVAFERVNTARRIEVCLLVARLRAKELGLIVFDNLECLDAETMAEFERQALASGLQYLLGRVRDCDLTVRQIEAPEDPAELRRGSSHTLESAAVEVAGA